MATRTWHDIQKEMKGAMLKYMFKNEVAFQPKNDGCITTYNQVCQKLT